MLTAIGLFFKEKLFNLTGIVIGIFVLIFSLFLFYNSDMIMTKLGFETKTNLRAQIVEVSGKLKAAEEDNATLRSAIATLEFEHKAQLAALQKSYDESEKARNVVEKKLAEYKTKSEGVKKVIKEKTVTTDTTITIPIAESKVLSEMNADLIHSTFDQLQLSQ
jgi:hypothetical protein